MRFLGKTLRVFSIIINIIYIALTFYLMIFRVMIDDGTANLMFISIISFIAILILMIFSREFHRYQRYLLIALGILIFLNYCIIYFKDGNLNKSNIIYSLAWLIGLPISISFLAMITNKAEKHKGITGECK